jgi:hypothetical protein
MFQKYHQAIIKVAEILVYKTLVLLQRCLLSKLMEDMQRLAVSSSQRQSSTRGEGSNASPVAALVPSHDGPGVSKSDKVQEEIK